MFLEKSLSSSTSIPVIDWIKCKLDEKTEAYTFVSSIFSESLLTDNQSVFKDLNVIQLGIDKTDAW